MNETVELVTLSDLKRDPELLPRGKVDSLNVSQLAEALREGVELPPIVIDTKHNLVADGFHRCEAYERVMGLDAQIPAIRKEFKNKAEILLYSAEVNNGQGKPLSNHDQNIAAHKLREMGVSWERISACLNVGVPKLKNRVLMSGPVEKRPGVLTDPVVLKRDFKHLEGQPLTTSQHIAHAKASGAGVIVEARQVMRRLESETINWEHENLKKTLAALRDLLINEPNLIDVQTDEAA